MKRLARLYEAIDASTASSAKVGAIEAMLREGCDEEASWILHVLLGGTIPRTVTARTVARWVREHAGVPDWLFRECHAATGDLGEAIALLIDGAGRDGASADGHGDGLTPGDDDAPLQAWIETHIGGLALLEPSDQRARVLTDLQALPRLERFLYVKLLTGALRVGVAKGLVVRAIARHAGLPEELVAQRLGGSWRPGPGAMERLLAPAGAGSGHDATSPMPFALATPIEEIGAWPEALGDAREWIIEWKWDGIRAQVVRRGGELAVWSRGDEVLTERLPEVTEAVARLGCDAVLDGEVVAWRDGPLGFGVLQRRIGRRALSRGVLRDAPVAFLAFDLLRLGHEDLRERPLAERRALLADLVARAGHPRLRLSEALDADSWEAARALRGTSRARGVEGLVLKRATSRYFAGRVRGDWWKWKIEPRTLDAVLLAGEPGHGRRAGLLTDYTFGVWREGVLVPVARAYSGLDNEEIAALDRWLRAHTREMFGRVRQVEPSRVFEIAFEGIARSSRHRAGVALRFPRIVRERTDKRAADASTLEELLALLPPEKRVEEETLFG
jgi:DNA ligase-1